jgi:hypothetical protein
LPLLGGFSCKVYLQHLSKFYFRKHAFCFLPLAAILGSHLFFTFLHLLMCIHYLGHLSLPYPHPQLPGRTCVSLFFKMGNFARCGGACL